MTQIFKRVVRLQRVNLLIKLLSIYYNFSTSSITNINSDLVTGITKELASELYNMHDKNKLRLITCHLLRIGAFCTLFSQGIPTEQIKKILCSRNDTWDKYILLISCVADCQNAAMSASKEISNL